MRVLYPSAHHDRFAHSLGVYHLGRIAFGQLEASAKTKVNAYCDEALDWDLYRDTFLVACLLHDCGHAPFSHLFEGLYEDCHPDAILSRRIAKPAEGQVIPGAMHEKISAILLLDYFKAGIKKINRDINLSLAARMITGYRHYPHATPKDQFENCLIQLLNGRSIDVDKLDYIVRDTWASGVNNASIDIHRLLAALTIGTLKNGVQKEIVLSFDKSALSIIENVISARNYLFRWIYGHHKVCYDQWLLEVAVRSFFPPRQRQEALKAAFSLDAFKNPVKVGDYQLYLPTDGDLLFLLKNSMTNPFVMEWVSRKHMRRPVWKTLAEYACLFENKISWRDPAKNKEFCDRLKPVISTWNEENGYSSYSGPDKKTARDVPSEGEKCGAILLETDATLLHIKEQDIRVEVFGETRSFTALEAVRRETAPKPFYVYIPDVPKRKQEMLKKEFLNYT